MMYSHEVIRHVCLQTKESAATERKEVGAGPGELSAEIRRIALGDPKVTSVFKGGAKRCRELIEQKENPLKPGSLIYMIRNFKHAFEESGRDFSAHGTRSKVELIKTRRYTGTVQ